MSLLRRPVREAVEEGRFHIYAIDRIEEGWPILTGMEAGIMAEDESFPEGSVHNLVAKQLDEFVKEWNSMGEGQRPEGEGEGD